MSFLKDEFSVLVDQVELHNIQILSLGDKNNIIKLCNQGILKINFEAKAYAKTEDGTEYSAIDIADDIITKFHVGSTPRFYSNLTQSVMDLESGNLNCISMEELKQKVRYIESYLHAEYGIVADFSRALINKIELNRTFRTEYDFSNYVRIGLIMFSQLSDYYKFSFQAAELDKNIITELVAKTGKKQYEELKVYDKSFQLRIYQDIPPRIMRVELTYMGQDKIISTFGTDLLWNFNDDIVTNQYDKYFTSLFKKVDDYINKQVKLILKRIALMRQNKGINWCSILITEMMKEEKSNNNIPMVLDVSEIIADLEILKLDKRSKCRVKISLLNASKKSWFGIGEHQRLEELRGKILGKGLHRDVDLS